MALRYLSSSVVILRPPFEGLTTEGAVLARPLSLPPSQGLGTVGEAVVVVHEDGAAGTVDHGVVAPDCRLDAVAAAGAGRLDHSAVGRVEGRADAAVIALQRVEVHPGVRVL